MIFLKIRHCSSGTLSFSEIYLMCRGRERKWEKHRESFWHRLRQAASSGSWVWSPHFPHLGNAVCCPVSPSSPGPKEGCAAESTFLSSPCPCRGACLLCLLALALFPAMPSLAHLSLPGTLPLTMTHKCLYSSLSESTLTLSSSHQVPVIYFFLKRQE